MDFLGGGEIPPNSSINYVAMSKDTGRRLPLLYHIKIKISYMIWVLLQSESPCQHNDGVTFFLYLCVSQYQESF